MKRQYKEIKNPNTSIWTSERERDWVRYTHGYHAAKAVAMTCMFWGLIPILIACSYVGIDLEVGVIGYFIVQIMTIVKCIDAKSQKKRYDYTPYALNAREKRKYAEIHTNGIEIDLTK